MTKISNIIVISSIICGAFSCIQAYDRVKRWENDGAMGTGDMSNMFRGTAGVDYPDFKSIPNTSFRCEDVELYEGGLYADVETRCQVYHVCHDGRRDSFICGRGTIFNQQILACDYWYSAECDNAPSYYYLNSQIGNSVSSDTYSQNYGNGNQQNYPQGNQHISGRTDGTDRRSQVPNAGRYDGHNEKSCQCIKNSNVRPWSFPAGMMHGKDR